MTDSILDSIKKVLGLDPSYTAFDPDVIMHINTTFSVLNGLGIGPDSGFSIGDNTVSWDAYGAVSGDRNMNMVKSYIFLRVKMLFDPPATSFVIDAMRKQIEEFEFRISVAREDVSWKDPSPPPPPQELPWWGLY